MNQFQRVLVISVSTGVVIGVLAGIVMPAVGFAGAALPLTVGVVSGVVAGLMSAPKS
jgi:hypothetical protein